MSMLHSDCPRNWVVRPCVRPDMLKPNSRIHMMLASLVTVLIIGGFVCIAYSIYSATEATFPFLGWRGPPLPVFFLAATALQAIGWALGIDLGESRSSISVGGDDWD